MTYEKAKNSKALECFRKPGVSRLTRAVQDAEGDEALCKTKPGMMERRRGGTVQDEEAMPANSCVVGC